MNSDRVLSTLLCDFAPLASLQLLFMAMTLAILLQLLVICH